MARVVQRRTPPYLLIVFVLLFVISTVMAVLFFNKFTTADEKLQALEADYTKVISSSQTREPVVKAMIKKAGSSNVTVVAQLRNQVAALAQHITGAATSFEDAEGRIETMYERVKPPTRKGLLTHITEFHADLGTLDTEIKALKGDVKTAQDQVASLKTQLDQAQADFASKLQEKDAQIAALDQKFTEFEQQEQAKLATAKQSFDNAVAELTRKLKAAGDELTTRTRERDLFKTKYLDLLDKVRPDRPDFAKAGPRPDGKVRSVVPSQGVVYINIGTQDRVTEGLRFSVYPYTGVPEDGKGKAVIEVLNVDDEVSEARIIQQDKENPIVAGDVVVNLVFDALRNYKLLVEGNFDLARTGEPTLAGNKAIKALVRRYGGEVVNELSIETSFVILGEPPSKPKPPEDTDPQEAWDLYQERLKAFNRYEQTRATAKNMEIPVVSSERFLDLIGFVPSKLAKAG